MAQFAPKFSLDRIAAEMPGDALRGTCGEAKEKGREEPPEDGHGWRLMVQQAQAHRRRVVCQQQGRDGDETDRHQDRDDCLQRPHQAGELRRGAVKSGFLRADT